MGHRRQFPGGDARAFRAVTGAIQELVGVRLDAAVVVNLAGFVRLVDTIGGLWIDVPERLVDLNYPLEDGSGQQAVLVALARQVDPLALLPELKIASDNLWTTVPRAEVRALGEPAARADIGHVRTVQFVPTRYPSHLDCAEIARIRRVVRSTFEGQSTSPSSNSATPSNACP
jgi:hypothetical protein